VARSTRPGDTPGAVAPTPSPQRRPGGHRSRGGPQKAEDRPQDDRARLEALRDRLQGILDDPETPPRDMAAVSREYRQTLTALSQLAPPAAGTALDELRARRRKRGAS
jgi:hypothetical protein